MSKKTKMLVCDNNKCLSPNWDIVQGAGQCRTCGKKILELTKTKIEFVPYTVIDTVRFGDRYRLDGFSFGILRELDINPIVDDALFKDRIGHYLRSKNEYSRRNLIPAGEDYKNYDERFVELYNKIARENDDGEKPLSEHYYDWVKVPILLDRDGMLELFQKLTILFEDEKRVLELAATSKEINLIGLLYKTVSEKIEEGNKK